ncbi:2TM domain-containing protein [Polaribacter sp. R77954]|uniref:2TM domain-containing protein n=1 Tax=Polaribacter sp. R77954 TaxID=3093870 RepID=UPI0037C617DA
MRQRFTEEQLYILARKRVEKISKFYKHLATYLIINVFLSAIFIAGDINDGETFNEAFWNYHNYKIWLYWGIGILFQAISTFGLPMFLSKDWEERKINEYLKQEKTR